MKINANYDVSVIGAGPAGCVTALTMAQTGRRVLLLEANPGSARRLAGEWLHPPAVEMLERLGIDLGPSDPYLSGRGFAVFPDDGSEPVVLPYRVGTAGVSIEHHRLVGLLRDACEAHAHIDYRAQVRATRIDGQNLTLERKNGQTHLVYADLIVGASGRASVVHAALGLEKATTSYSRMAGLILSDVELPFEGFGHVFLGADGPMLAYRIARNKVRLCLDVPMSLPVNRDREATLWERFGPILPEALRAAFLRALTAKNVGWAQNQIRSRQQFGREGLVVVGDAAGHTHPLTAVGMTLGFADAAALAEAKSFAHYVRRRLRESRVPEMLAIALYEVFADPSDETVSIRRAVYELWRTNPEERLRTMGFLAGQDTRAAAFARSFISAIAICGRRLLTDGIRSGHWGHTADVTWDLADRMRWLLKGTLHLSPAEPKRAVPSAEERYGTALNASRPQAEVVAHPSVLSHLARCAREETEPGEALHRGVSALIAHQAEDGSWEGETVWCPMLPAQYVMTCHVVGQAIDDGRRRRLLKQFERTRLPSGTWGLHEVSEPYLFVTTLVYVAARLLGVKPDDPLIARAGDFIREEGGASQIPSWGKFWLAMLSLYDWDGIHPVLPETWRLPEWFPLHPAHYYCHTRLIYAPMAAISAERFKVHCSPVIQALRRELYPGAPYEEVPFGKMKDALRPADVFTPPSTALKAAYRVLSVVDRAASLGSRLGTRKDLLEQLREHIRYDLRATEYTSISGVSGLLNIIALWIRNPNDEDAKRALERLEVWVWEDEVDGTRIAGTRTATWDTSFAMQALAGVPDHPAVRGAVSRADAFLAAQRISRSTGEEHRFYRLDPTGGFCVAGRWHGWPVSDCTAEAVVARLGAGFAATRDELTSSVQFILRCQNADGGFGSYEARRSTVPLEWLNPAEMFGDSMTEHTYVECTASCIVALAEFSARYPDVMADRVRRAIAEGRDAVRRLQRPDGAWQGEWGVRFIYGTMFGIRGLLAAGVPPQDPDIRRACRWLLSHQRSDGSWGERHEVGATGFVAGSRGHAVQTAWALSALLDAREPNFEALERAARFLSAEQLPNGEWPKQEPVGIFFHTALLDYVLYRSYFPIWALAQFEARRQEREETRVIAASA